MGRHQSRQPGGCLQDWLSPKKGMKMTTRGLALALVLMCGLAVFGDQVDDYVAATMTRQHIPGVSLAIIRDGKVIKAKGYGLASIELNLATRPETVYELA
jgi:CubicO group peptidase (beta-lactamase class C family)